jgi:V/A-type H+-transporting ATPase subunit I
MAIARMEKTQILVHHDVQDRVMERIQELGQLHVTDIKTGPTSDRHPDLVSGVEGSDETMERRLSQIQFTLDFLSSVQKKKGFLSGLMAPRIILTPGQYEEVASTYDEGPTVSGCRDLDRERNDLLSAITKLEGTLANLDPWLSLDCPLEEISSTEHTSVFLGVLPAEAFEDFEKATSEFSDRMGMNTVSQDKETVYLLIGCHREVFSQVWDILKRIGFEQMSFPELRGTPEEVHRQTRARIEEHRRRIDEIERSSREYAKDRQNLQVLYDHLNSELQRRRMEAHFGKTERVSVIEGWIPGYSQKSFETTLTTEFKEVAILPAEPSEQEDPPVALDNSRTLIRPFEVVTELYGLPNSKEYDPSPLLAPFFFIFFGLCLTDAAYGIIMTVLFLFLMKKFKVTLGRVKLVSLLFFGGISTIGMGAITGGWFGDIVNYLPPWLDVLRRGRESLMLFDPMEQILIFMGLALVLGFTQICFGLMIRMVRRIREGDPLGAIFGPLPWLVILNGLIMFGLSKTGVFSPLIGTVGKFMALFAALSIILFTDRTSKSWFARIAWGIYGLYGITSYIGDILSYLRLFALGLATGIIGMVINTLADMLGGAPYIGWLLFAIIFIVGHLFNIIINGLGAFVHTLRLQYVEFFPKFFEGGGKAYQPFQKEAKYTILVEE